MTPDKVRDAFRQFVMSHLDESFPWEGIEGRCAFRADMDESLAPAWQEEVAELLRVLATALEERTDLG